jgi:hypothetical protein
VDGQRKQAAELLFPARKRSEESDKKQQGNIFLFSSIFYLTLITGNLIDLVTLLLLSPVIGSSKNATAYLGVDCCYMKKNFIQSSYCFIIFSPTWFRPLPAHSILMKEF